MTDDLDEVRNLNGVRKLATLCQTDPTTARQIAQGYFINAGVIGRTPTDEEADAAAVLVKTTTRTKDGYIDPVLVDEMFKFIRMAKIGLVSDPVYAASAVVNIIARSFPPE